MNILTFFLKDVPTRTTETGIPVEIAVLGIEPTIIIVAIMTQETLSQRKCVVLVAVILYSYVPPH